VGLSVIVLLMVVQFLEVLAAGGAVVSGLVVLSAAILAAGIAVAVGSMMWVSAAMRGPLTEIRGHLDRFAVQDFDIVVRPSPIKEFTRITFLLNAVRAHLVFARQEQEELQLLARRQREHALNAMATTVETESAAAVDQVTVHTNAMRDDAQAMARGAQQVAENAASVAAASNEALASAETVAAAGEELTASIAEINAQVRRAADLTSVAVDKGGETSTVLDSMKSEVTQIGEIADLIQEIASKTNLLALNASIEAARAGEAGRGFAVVAEEVKGLANQTAASTQRISEQIQSVNAVTARAVVAVSDIVAKVGEIDQVAGSIADAMHSQASATDEISRSVTETSEAAREVARQIEMVSNEAHSTEEKSQHLMAALGEVAEAVIHLKSAVVQAVRNSSEEIDRRQHTSGSTSPPA
jgi:methyl-accepting chemotaxis protein